MSFTGSDDDQEQDSGYRGQERRLSDDFRCSSSGSAGMLLFILVASFYKRITFEMATSGMGTLNKCKILF